MNVPAAVAAMVIAAQSGNHDPLDNAYRDATPVFDVPALRAVGAVSHDGLYPQRQLACEFLLYSAATRAQRQRRSLSPWKTGRNGATRWPSWASGRVGPGRNSRTLTSGWR